MRNVIHDNILQVQLQSELQTNYDNIDKDYRNQLRSLIDPKDPESVATVL
jgi:hypothetical protein